MFYRLPTIFTTRVFGTIRIHYGRRIGGILMELDSDYTLMIGYRTYVSKIPLAKSFLFNLLTPDTRLGLHNFRYKLGVF